MLLPLSQALPPTSPFPGSSADKESASNAGDPSSIPGSGRAPGGGIGSPLQYSWLLWWLDGKESACNGGPVVKTALPLQRAQVHPLIGEVRSSISTV